MAELVWDGKCQGRKRVAPSRIALPFRTVEIVDESVAPRWKALDPTSAGWPTDWRNRLIWGDEKYVLPSLLAELAGKVNLVYVDPPFGTGADFSFTKEVPPTGNELGKTPAVTELKAYRDTWRRGLDGYLRWFHETAVLLRELLADDGSIYVHLDENVVHYVKIVMDEVFGIQNFQREIVWRIGWISGYKSTARNWIRNHDTILFYAKDRDAFTFNKEYLPYPEDYVRRDGKKPTGKGFPIDDVWNGSEQDRLDSIQIMSFSGEKVGYPTQKNEKLVARIVNASSNPGDLVLDCFCGSGTTAAVAEKLGRRWIAADLGRFAVQTTRKRLLDVENVSPFVVQDLGEGERLAWMKAEFEHPGDPAAMKDSYRRFILELFEAEPIAGSAWLHGRKGGRLVHVGAVDAPVTLADVESIARELWRVAGTGASDGAPAAADILGWEFAFELDESARRLAAEARVDLTFRRIPREVLETGAVERGDVGAKAFLELRALSVKVAQAKRSVRLELTHFSMPPEDLPAEVAKGIEHWSQWIDSWAVDWDFKGDGFHHRWQSVRSRAEPKLALTAGHAYRQPGRYAILVKAIDLLGNDTTKRIVVEVA